MKNTLEIFTDIIGKIIILVNVFSIDKEQFEKDIINEISY